MSVLGKTDWTLRIVAREASCQLTQGTIYNYVSSKDDILYIWQKNYKVIAAYPPSEHAANACPESKSNSDAVGVRRH